jgi:glycosyltransferase involved in cell wall biosynthesis
MKYIATLFFLGSISFLSYLNADQESAQFRSYPQDPRLMQSEPLINDERHMVIIICSYNNAKFYAWNLDSVLEQEYSNYHVIYIDDCSTDGTYDLVKKYLQGHMLEDRFIVFKNDINRKALANLYYAIHTCKPTDIIVILDGDDRFAHTKVLQRINQTYADSNIWLTYGQFREYPSGMMGFCHPYPQDIIDHNAFRRYPDTPSHLRTFYAGLFHKIKQEDLLFKGEFFSMTYDLAIMFPMIEMAQIHHQYINEVLVHYNNSNPINDHRVSKGLQRKFDLIIRARASYSKIDSPF